VDCVRAPQARPGQGRRGNANYVAKQQRIGERLTRAMAKACMDRRELATLTGYSEVQIVRWERGGAPALPDKAHKALSCARREAGVAAVLGAPPLLISSLCRRQPLQLSGSDSRRNKSVFR